MNLQSLPDQNLIAFESCCGKIDRSLFESFIPLPGRGGQGSIATATALDAKSRGTVTAQAKCTVRPTK